MFSQPTKPRIWMIYDHAWRNAFTATFIGTNLCVNLLKHPFKFRKIYCIFHKIVVALSAKNDYLINIL